MAEVIGLEVGTKTSLSIDVITFKINMAEGLTFFFKLPVVILGHVYKCHQTLRSAEPGQQNFRVFLFF